MGYKWVADEFNFLKDRDGMRFDCEHYYNPGMEPEKAIKAVFNNSQNLLLSFVKPTARGVLIGGLVGAAANYIAGESLQNGFEIGAIYGGFIDFSQYNARFYIEYFRSIKAAKRKFAETHPEGDS
jgi:hypothetical protein